NNTDNINNDVIEIESNTILIEQPLQANSSALNQSESSEFNLERQIAGDAFAFAAGRYKQKNRYVCKNSFENTRHILAYLAKFNSPSYAESLFIKHYFNHYFTSNRILNNLDFIHLMAWVKEDEVL